MEVDVNEENIDSWMESVLPEVWWCFWRWSRRLGKKKKKKKRRDDQKPVVATACT